MAQPKLKDVSKYILKQPEVRALGSWSEVFEIAGAWNAWMIRKEQKLLYLRNTVLFYHEDRLKLQNDFQSKTVKP